MVETVLTLLAKVKNNNTEHKRATRNGDVNNHIAEHHLQTEHQIPDLDTYYVFHRLLSTTHFRKLVYYLRTNASES